MRGGLTICLYWAGALLLSAAPSVALAVAPIPSSLEPASSTVLVAHLIDRERSSWTELQRHDKQAWESLLSATYSHVNTSNVRMDLAGILHMFPDEVVEAYSLHDMRATLLRPDVVLVAYWVERTSKFPGTFVSNTVWVKQSGNWLRVHYQETAMLPSPANKRGRNATTTAQPL